EVITATRRHQTILPPLPGLIPPPSRFPRLTPGAKVLRPWRGCGRRVATISAPRRACVPSSAIPGVEHEHYRSACAPVARRARVGGHQHPLGAVAQRATAGL